MDATYTEAMLPEYRGNPLIEALPPVIRDDMEITQSMSASPLFDPEERQLDAAVRREMVSRLDDLFIPLPSHFQLLERLSTNLRRSYTWRNPMLPQTQAFLHQRGVSLSPETLAARAAAGSVMFIKGLSGIGKSTGIEACLRALGPCVIEHKEYQGRKLAETQIAWLKVSCPEDRSLKSLCVEILSAAEGALGGKARYSAEYRDDPRMTAGVAVRGVMQCIANHHVGILVIDEVQNLFSSKGRAAIELLNFLLRLRDESGISFVICGTYASLQLLQNTFRIGRRLVAGGVTEFARPISGEDEEWQSFCEILWMYQWVRDPAEFTPAIAMQMFDLTQGIRGLAVPLMARAQEDAIADGSERVTAESLRASCRRHFNQLDRPIAALRENNPAALAEWDDLCDGELLLTDVMAPQFMNRPAGVAAGSQAGKLGDGESAAQTKPKVTAAKGMSLGCLMEEGGLKALSKDGVVGVDGLGLG